MIYLFQANGGGYPEDTYFDFFFTGLSKAEVTNAIRRHLQMNYKLSPNCVMSDDVIIHDDQSKVNFKYIDHDGDINSEVLLIVKIPHFHVARTEE